MQLFHKCQCKQIKNKQNDLCHYFTNGSVNKLKINKMIYAIIPQMAV